MCMYLCKCIKHCLLCLLNILLPLVPVVVSSTSCLLDRTLRTTNTLQTILPSNQSSTYTPWPHQVPIGVPIVSYTWHLIRFGNQVAAGKTTVLEDYWELRGEIYARVAGKHTLQARFERFTIAFLQKEKFRFSCVRFFWHSTVPLSPVFTSRSCPG